MIKFVDMTPTLRASDPSAPPTCAFLNTETGRFCEHGGTGEHLFTSADDVVQHGPPASTDLPSWFFTTGPEPTQWVNVPRMCLVRDVDGDYAIKRSDDGGEFVGWDGGKVLTDSRNRSSWSASVVAGWGKADSRDDLWTIVATGLRGDETADELRALVGVEPA